MPVTEPGQAEVLGWLDRYNASPIEAARNFFPGASPEDTARLADKYRKWQKRREERGEAPTHAAQGSQRGPAPPLPDPEPPCYDLADTPEMSQLRELLATAWADYNTARKARDLRLASTLRREIADFAARLESLRQKAARVVKLDRTASAVATELAKRQKAIEMRAEMERRAAERKAKATEAKKARTI